LSVIYCLLELETPLGDVWFKSEIE
jgi:hypothetical protein